MRSSLPIIAVLLLVSVPQHASAQAQDEQQACENDVFSLCGEAIPDRDRITACLRRNWKDVSRQCRSVLANYGRRHGHDRVRSRADRIE